MWRRIVLAATMLVGVLGGESPIVGQSRTFTYRHHPCGTLQEANYPDTGQRGASSGKPRRLSILDAAAKVLGGADGPMSCGEMVERMTAKGHWSPPSGGKTPAATLYSAILREIQRKGNDSRFAKIERGKFGLSAKH